MTDVSWSPRGVGHPLWLASLVLLLVNDHLLKGAGLLPGWLTGKLSDFAGLIVAPVLIAVVVRARRASARAAACALVAAVFVAIKLSPAAARALEHVLAFAHLRGRVWCDATDLAALVVLPAAWWLTGWRARTARPTGVARRAFERASVIAGALACVATMPQPGPVTVSLLLVNRTQAAQEVAVYRRGALVEPRPDCPALEAGDLRSLGAASFMYVSCEHLEPGRYVDLEMIVGCGAVVIRAVGLADTVLTWPAAPPPSDDALANQVWLEEEAGSLRIGGTDYVDAAPAAFTLPASNCPGLP